VELRAVDASDGDEIDRSEASEGATARVCAEAVAARTVRFEARSSSGRVDAVIGERAYAPGSR
jgi:hypothetical protein